MGNIFWKKISTCFFNLLINPYILSDLRTTEYFCIDTQQQWLILTSTAAFYCFKGYSAGVFHVEPGNIL